MFESKSESIANCLCTTQSTYMLARDFGIDLIDKRAGNPRRSIQIQLSTYYPDVSISSITATSSSIQEGQFEYIINVKE